MEKSGADLNSDRNDFAPKVRCKHLPKLQNHFWKTNYLSAVRNEWEGWISAARSGGHERGFFGVRGCNSAKWKLLHIRTLYDPLGQSE